ncbi:MAG TPA: hypothetical protein VF937_01725 [Chloroflexota bacterium]
MRSGWSPVGWASAVELFIGALACLLLGACGTAAPAPTASVAASAPAAAGSPASTTPGPGARPAAATTLSPTVLAPTPSPGVSVLTRQPVPPTEPAELTPTPETVRVGSTSDQRIYLYHSPTTGDRIQDYPEGTPLRIIGGDVEGDGLTWHNVRAPDGTEGYIPVGDTVPDTST